MFYYYICIVFDLSVTLIIRIKMRQVIIFRYFDKIMVKAIFTIIVKLQRGTKGLLTIVSSFLPRRYSM